MGDLSNFEIGQTVELQDGRTGTVRYVGNSHFAAGDWIGIELDDASGKNDGSVQDERYFHCESGHGMFVRPSVATVIDQPTPRPTKKTSRGPNGPLVKSRQSVAAGGALRRQSVLDKSATKRNSIIDDSPTPSTRSSTSSRLSPSKSPTKMSVSRPSAGSANLRNLQPPSALKPKTLAGKSQAGPWPRPSIGILPSTTSRGPRQSLLGSLSGSAKASLPTTRRLANRLSTLQQGSTRSDSLSEGSQTSENSGQDSPQDRELLSPSNRDPLGGRLRSPLSPAISRTSAISRSIASPSTMSSRAGTFPAEPQRPPEPTLTSMSSIMLGRQVEDLKTKLRVMEKKRLEDREKMKALDKIQADRDKFEGIIQKLQAKYQPQQQETAELRRQIKEAETRFKALEIQHTDFDSVVEMATLDREMAEETAEALKTELDALRQRNEEVELEVEILREENTELGKAMSPEEKTSQGWMQMERNNDRLREALLRLRDITQEQEAALKQQVKELETDVKELGKYQDLFQDAKERLTQSEVVVEDLRQQLETALGAEEMIEELTEKNLSLKEVIDELKAAVEDLESLKELNDELEINHVETEKQMQDEIDYRDVALLEQNRKSNMQDEAIEDLEYTVSRFRDLVNTLQSDLEDIRASQQVSETEANELSNRSKAMLDLNLRLQLSASKAQVKAIDLELGKLQAQESAEHLKILQLFLPDNLMNERESVNALLRFKRVGFKASLLHCFLKEHLNNPPMPGREEDIFASCEILDNLVWISTMCDRFAQFIYSSSIEAFEKLGSALYDLDPVERALNTWIDALKRGELKEQQCAAELHRSISLMKHLAEVHIADSLDQYAEDIHMRAVLMFSNLENAALALSGIKGVAKSRMPSSPGESHEEEEDEALKFVRKADSLISQIRSAKVVSNKAVHQIKELKSRSLTLDPSTLPTIEQFQSSTLELARTCRQIGLTVVSAMNEEGRDQSLTYDDVLHILSPADSSLSKLASKTHTVTSQMQSLYSLTTTLAQTVEFPASRVPPWESVSQKLRTASETSAAYKREVVRLKDELSERNTALAMKGKIVEEMAVNVEVLEKRVGESSGRREKLRELEGAVESSKAREKETAKRIASLERDIRALEAERETLRKQRHRTGAQAGLHDGVAPDRDNLYRQDFPTRAQDDIAQLNVEIATLQSTIRHLRSSMHQRTIDSSHAFLATALLRVESPARGRNLAYEAQDLLGSMVTLVTRPENQVVRLEALNREARLGWRPMRQTPRWQLSRQREDWEVWKEWRDDMSRRSTVFTQDKNRTRLQKRGKSEIPAKVGFATPGIDGESMHSSGEVRIARPEDWEEFEVSLGLPEV